MPVVPMMPIYMAAPMYTTAARQYVAEEPRTRSEPNCATSKDRLDTLEMQVEALNLRMKTILRSVEIQQVILEEIKNQGKQ
jgi:hypothetical protein